GGARRPVLEVLQDLGQAPLQLRVPLLVELEAQPDRAYLVGGDLAQLLEEGGGEDLADLLARGVPGGAGGQGGELAGAAVAAAGLLGRQQPGADERAYVVQGRGRGDAEQVGDLLVGARAVQADPQDPQAQR